MPISSTPPAYARSTVAIVPASLPLYLDAQAPALAGRLDRDRLYAAIERYLARHPYVELVPSSVARERIEQRPDIARTRHEASQRLGFGEAHYFNLDVENAVLELNQARALYADGLGEILDGDEPARTYQYLAFSLLDQATRDPDRFDTNAMLAAQEAMVQMVRIAPSIVLDASRQPPERVRLYQEARAQYLSDPALRRADPTQVRRIAQALEVDYLLYVQVVQEGDGTLYGEIEVYDARADTLELQRAQLQGGGHSGDLGERAGERLDALLSRFASCISPRPAPPEPGDDLAGRIFVDTGFQYFVFLESPTSSAFDNIGASFRVSYMVTDNFATAARFGLAFSGDDRESDLRSTFNSFRGSLGITVSANLGPLRPYFHSGLEVAKPTNFVVTHSTMCKGFGIDDPIDCLPGDVSSFDVDLLSGLTAAAGLSAGIDPVFFFGELNASFYVFPVDQGKELNFPVGFDAGLEYRF